jgi:hypothetical protein
VASPVIDANNPNARGRCSGPNAADSTDKAADATAAAPTPRIARVAMSQPRLGASAQPAEVEGGDPKEALAGRRRRSGG